LADKGDFRNDAELIILGSSEVVIKAFFTVSGADSTKLSSHVTIFPFTIRNFGFVGCGAGGLFELEIHKLI
jgi:hypothetical protein